MVSTVTPKTTRENDTTMVLWVAEQLELIGSRLEIGLCHPAVREADNGAVFHAGGDGVWLKGDGTLMSCTGFGMNLLEAVEDLWDKLVDYTGETRYIVHEKGERRTAWQRTDKGWQIIMEEGRQV